MIPIQPVAKRASAIQARLTRGLATTLGAPMTAIMIALASTQAMGQTATPQTDHAEPASVPPTIAPPDGLLQRGTGAFVTPPASSAPPSPAAASEVKLDIVFDRTPVALVVQSLLADFTRASVVIDPRVTGDITIRSRGQLSASELPGFLRASVQPLGLELVDQGPNAYLLRPARTQAQGAGAEVFRPGAQTQSGFVIYGLRYVAAADMTRLLQPIARQGVTIQSERNREMLILSGPPDQVESLVRTIEILDVDWLDGMSFALAPLEYADPETLIAEVRTLFGGAEGPIGSMVEFVALPGRRAILVLAKRPERLDQARTWITQLDRPLGGGGRLRFIQLQHANAAHVAETVAKLFETGAEAPASPQPSTPGAGAAAVDRSVASPQPGRTRVTADSDRNAIIVQSDPETFEDIAALVRNLDTAVDQVVIETTIAEVTLNNDLRFGLQWSFNTRDGGRVTLSEGATGAIVGRFPGLSYGYSGNFVQAALNALASRTNVEVISTPVIVTLDNQEATLEVGDEVPIVTQTTTNVTTTDPTIISTVQYRQTGILLRVTPRISASGAVTLEVKQEASEVSATTTSGIDSPTIQQRRFESTITIADNETVALGGLIRANRTRTKAGVPWLSSVPLIGAAFRNTNETVRRTELLIFMTPRIVRSAADARAATDDLEKRLERIRASRFIQRNSAPQ
ncbi:MAG: proteinral secretion pathway protein D [Alphaproteobacteria bacterium]|nr:MAG: proteinral secretion pathway protein D [Caulobacteraceae bacterium]TPW07057.1 MAG: proteinral secretion pathway protein D [Alphaproteobacteria bacterium]